MQLQNKVAVISGGASGLGEATAKQLVSQGVKVALLDSNSHALKKVATEINALSLVCDVTSAEEVEAAVRAIVKEFAAIHIVVNCAGIAPAAKIVGREEIHSLDLFKKVLDVNLVGTFNVLRLCAAQMTTQQPYDDDGARGVIINTASVAAFEGQIGQAAYSASKGGLVAMTLPIARELARFGIRVLAIAPGIMHTPMMAAMPEKVQHALAASVTFPKRLGQAQEYAKLVQAMIENDYLNGEVVRLDGGIRMTEK